MKEINFTHGGITGKMVMFAWPMIAGNFLQQLYNVTDTVIVGKYLGANALAAVGSAYALMTFITSILLGLSLGSGAVFSMRFGEQNWTKLKNDAVAAFVLIAVITVIMNIVVFAAIELISAIIQDIDYQDISKEIFEITELSKRDIKAAASYGSARDFSYTKDGCVVLPPRDTRNYKKEQIIRALSEKLRKEIDLVVANQLFFLYQDQIKRAAPGAANTRDG